MDPWQIVAILATFIATSIAAIARAAIRGDVVAGSTYRLALEGWAAERKARQLAERRADKADIQVDRNTDAVREVTATVKLALGRRDDPGDPRG